MHTTKRLFSTIALMFATVSCYEVQYDEPREDETNMALDTNFIPQVADPNSLVPGNAASKVYEVKSGTPTQKNDIDFNNTVIERQVFTLNSQKVDRAGDTMTGTLTITPSTAVPALALNAATNTTAVAVNGNGSAAAVTILSGASNGAVVAQSNNSAYVLDLSNSGAGGAISATGSVGSTSPVLNVGVGDAIVATQARFAIQTLGAVAILGTPINADVDPGIDGYFSTQNMLTSRAVISISGGTLSVLNNKGFNVASVAQVGGSPDTGVITFARALPGNDYGIRIDVGGSGNGKYRAYNEGTQNTTNFRFKVWDTLAGADVADISTLTAQIFVATEGF